MKNIKKILVLALLLAFPIISFASIDADLRYGATGAQVSELQEFLIDKGFLTSQPTGNFFSLTKSAVIKYQGSVGLPTTGFVGPMTREKINAELASTVSEEEKSATVANNSDAVAIQKQIDEILKQFGLLKDQQQTQTQAIQQTQQTLQTIAENTTPAPQNYGSVQTVPEAKKELVLNTAYYMDPTQQGYPFVPVKNNTIYIISRGGFGYAYLGLGYSYTIDGVKQSSSEYSVMDQDKSSGWAFYNPGEYTVNLKVYKVMKWGEYSPGSSQFSEVPNSPTVSYTVTVLPDPTVSTSTTSN